MGTEKLLSTSSGLTELCKLAEYYGTDKAGWYTPFYDLLFRDRRDKVYKVLEIGIGTKRAMSHVPDYRPGASLRMWRDYFPNAEIFALDSDSAAIAYLHGIDSRRITAFRCDQSSVEELETIVPLLLAGGRFDLIVDDGSHKLEDQIFTFRMLSPLLDSRGLYIIEDAPYNFSDLLPEHSNIVHHHDGLLSGYCTLIRGEALNG